MENNKIIETGQRFAATTKLGQVYRYKFKGLDLARPFIICLWNLDLEEDTLVEPEWFNQRKIEIEEEE